MKKNASQFFALAVLKLALAFAFVIPSTLAFAFTTTPIVPEENADSSGVAITIRPVKSAKKMKSKIAKTAARPIHKIPVAAAKTPTKKAAFQKTAAQIVAPTAAQVVASVPAPAPSAAQSLAYAPTPAPAPSTAKAQAATKTSVAKISAKNIRPEKGRKAIPNQSIATLAFTDPDLGKTNNSGSADFGPISATQSSYSAVNEKTSNNKFSADLYVTNFSNLLQDDQSGKSNYFNFDLVPKYSYSSNLSFSLLGSVIRDYKNPEQPYDLANTMLSTNIANLSTTLGTAQSTINVSPTFYFLFPTNQLQVKEERFQGAFGGKFNFSYSRGMAQYSFTTGVRKNIHEYELDYLGNRLIEYVLPQEMQVQLNWNKSLQTRLLGRYIYGRIYNNAGERTKLLSRLDATYQLYKNWNLFGGITTETNAFKDNGVDANASMFNEENTEIFLGVNLHL